MKKGGVKAEWIWLPIFALFLLWAGPAAADNAECLKCHNNPKLSKGKKDGALLSLHVNEEAFKASVHGAAGMGCVDCHQEAKATHHPAEGFPETGCGACHADQLEAYKKTSHGMMRESGMEEAPRCADCHTAHYARKVADLLSPVSEARLPTACAQCHWQAKQPGGFFTALATYRIMGHPKEIWARNTTPGPARSAIPKTPAIPRSRSRRLAAGAMTNPWPPPRSWVPFT